MKNKIIKNKLSKKISKNRPSKNIYILASISILALFLFISIGSAAFCVGNVSNSDDCTSNKTYVTIQEAIDEVPIGGWILIAEGIYNETLDLRGNETTIKGEGVGKTIINASASGDTGPAIHNFGHGTNILNLKLIGSNDYGFKISNTEKITLENIEVTGSNKTGIDFNSVNDIVMKNVKVENNGGAGIVLRNVENVSVDGVETNGNNLGGLALLAPNSSANITITNSVFSDDNASGIFVQHGGIFENILIKNNIFNNNGVGFFVEDNQDIGTPDVTGFKLKHNTFNMISEAIINEGIGRLDATNNFWGSSNPDFDELVSGNVSLIPFCMTSDCVEGSLGNSSEVEVNVSTPIGINVTQDFFGGQGSPGGVSIEFSNTSQSTGFTTVKISLSPGSNPDPEGFDILGNYFDVSIDDLGAGAILCFTPLSGKIDSNTKLLNFKSGEWNDVTGEIKSGINTVCSVSMSNLSPFILVKSSDTSSEGSPSPGGGSSAGGGGGVVMCITEWSCTEWSECSDLGQTRTCSYPENYCEPRENKPVEFRDCELPEEEISLGESGESETEESESSGGASTTMTGAVIGTNTGRGIAIAIIFILIIGLTYAIVRNNR